MPPVVRVIGRIDFAEEICRTLRGAGMDAQAATAAPMSVYGGTPPADGVDVVLATTIFDPSLWRLAKSKHPLRPMVAVAEQRRERVLLGALRRRNGPDAYVTWPATAAELTDAVQRAVGSAGRSRSWGRPDVLEALVLVGLLLWCVGGPAATVGALVLGVALFLGLPFAWSPWWQAACGMAFAGYGAAVLVLTVLQRFH